MNLRINKFSAAWIAIVSIAFSSVCVSAPIVVQLSTEENPPYQSENPVTKQIAGMSINVISELFKRAEVEYRISVFPWARAYQFALSNENAGVFGTMKTKERESLFEWVGPISKSRWVLYALADSKIKITNLNEAKKYRIGGYVGDAKSKFLEDRGLKVDLVNSNELNVKKLSRGRIDLWVAGNVSGKTIAANSGVKDIKEIFTFNESEGFIAFNKKSNKDVLGRLRLVIKKMNETGEIENLMQKYSDVPQKSDGY